MVNPTTLRKSIPALDDVTYMNFGASGPSPRAVVEAATDAIEHHEYVSHGSEGPYTAAFDAYDEVRSSIAGFVGADPAEIALTQSTTDGINRIACALDWNPGDIVVRTDLEHPAGILPWQRLERTSGVEVRVVEHDGRGRIDRDRFTEAVDGATLVCLSALTWNYGTRLPVRELVEIAHDAGAFVLVDAVQTPGQAPMDVRKWGADAVAGAGHKWLLGLWGAGFLYVDEAVAERLSPRTIGYRSVVEPTAEQFEFLPGAARFEVGTINPAPHVALGAAIELVEEIGVRRIEDRIAALAARFVDGVPDDRLMSPSTPESGLVTIDVDDPEGTVERLREEGIVVRSLAYPEAIRASIHAVNTEAEVDAVLAALERSWEGK